MKVAQYEVLGQFFKSDPSRPVRHSQDDEGGTGRSTQLMFVKPHAKG